MDPRTPGGSEQQSDPAEVPGAPGDAPTPAPSRPAPMPWERPQTQPPDQPRSTIISAEPVLTGQPGAPAPEVAWAPPSPPTQERHVPGAPGFVFASTSRRFVAWVIDNFLLSIAVALLAGVAAVALSIDTQRDTNAVSAAFSVIYVALSFVYFVLFWTSKRPATPGMRALKIQIGTAFDGKPLEFGSGGPSLGLARLSAQSELFRPVDRRQPGLAPRARVVHRLADHDDRECHQTGAPRPGRANGSRSAGRPRARRPRHGVPGHRSLDGCWYGSYSSS